MSSSWSAGRTQLGQQPALHELNTWEWILNKGLMTTSSNDNILLYMSRWCAHSMSVERFLDRNNVVVEKINVDGDSKAREELIRLNGGYASVPTLLFPDGTKLTEPSFSQIRKQLEMEPPPSLVDRIKKVFGQGEAED